MSQLPDDLQRELADRREDGTITLDALWHGARRDLSDGRYLVLAGQMFNYVLHICHVHDTMGDIDNY